jgi:peptidoglycan/xylan/chitin deacetylase (PgdA/CDA1 family)
VRKKEMLAIAMHRLGAWRVVRSLRCWSPDRLTILAYHRVLDIDAEDHYPFDIELISATTEDFDWQMKYVTRNFDVLSFKDVLDHQDRGVRCPKKSLVVTFDDGFHDNYLHAFPVLKSIGIPATFFVTSGYIGTQKRFWFEAVAYALMRVPPRSISIAEVGSALPTDADVEARRASIAKLLSLLKTLPDTRRLEIVETIERLCSPYLEPRESSLSSPMTWEQVVEMSTSGMEIGSHTVSHPVLSMVSRSQLQEEMARSKIEIEAHTSKTVDVISYPVGLKEAFDEEVLSAARCAGYRLACSYVPGTNSFGKLNEFRLCRQHVERYTTASYFAGLVTLPSVFV